MSAFRLLQVPGDWDSLSLKSQRNSEVSSRMSFQAASSQLCRHSVLSTQSAPRGRCRPSGSAPRAHTPPQLEGAGCIDSELPVIHLQAFQVCHQAEDSTGILRLTALKVGDGGDRAKQLGQCL
ncbi:hypothetical protein I79_009678 [Cricetulus griseus]|uniref:Uncharacterized protein n=1 Tax=Cricetulus griseus TaxID=10029 RepID=G3HGF3_CRIGR|nr:hypothetical protein I79_025887 [Cricetulus griseus]EGV96780.1 hypothetical protein I79_009678 [Cricetulus griseus]